MAAKHVDFAELLRSLASAASRRGVLVGLTSSLLAGVPLGLDLPIAGAKKGESEDWFAGYQLSAISGWLVPTPDSRLPTYDSRLVSPSTPDFRRQKGHPDGCSSL